MTEAEDAVRQKAKELDAAIVALWNENSNGMALPFGPLAGNVEAIIQLIRSASKTSAQPVPEID